MGHQVAEHHIDIWLAEEVGKIQVKKTISGTFGQVAEIFKKITGSREAKKKLPNTYVASLVVVL